MNVPRFFTGEELRQRYGEEGVGYSIFYNDCGSPMVRVPYCKVGPISIDLIFSKMSPVDEDDKTIDPTIPMADSISHYEHGSYKIKTSSLTGGRYNSYNELHLTSTTKNSMLKIFEISRTNGGKIPVDISNRIEVFDGKCNFMMTKVSEDEKTVTVYVLATATEKPGVLNIVFIP